MLISSDSEDKKQNRDINCFYLFLLLFFISCLCGGIWGSSGSGSFSFAGIVFTGGRFIMIYFGIWLTLLFAFFYFPFQNFTKKNILLIIIIVVVSRVLIFFQAPSDDVYRYLWEGTLFAKGINPYLFPPNDISLAGFAKDFPFHSFINHQDIAAAYPPLIIYIFSLITKVSLSLFLFKAFLLFFDIGGVLFLLFILTKREINIRWILLYALNPLILYSFAGEGHFDSMQNFFLLGALFFYDRKKWLFMFVFAGLAVQVKYVAIITIRFFINRENYKLIPVVFFPIILPYLLFLTENMESIFAGIRKFESEFAFNGSVHSIFRLISGEIKTATFICRALFTGFMLFGIIKLNNLTRGEKQLFKIDPAMGILYAFSLLIILSPTVHIWYLSWVLPFAVIRNKISWIILSGTACLYFTAKSNAWLDGVWAMPVWAQITEWVPFFIFFGFELYYILKRGLYNNFEIPKSISVVIPVLNEENKIEECILNIKKDSSVSEIIVVDGGSKDNSVSVAKSIGAQVIINRRSIDKGGGRGGQILSGIKAASGDIIAVVHSDVLICSRVFLQMKEFLKLNPDVVGGAVGTKFLNNSIKIRFIEFLNSLRVVFFGISFGDQIQFFRRKEVIKNDLFPDIPLMEDVEFSLRLPKAGRRVFLFGDAQVSLRRWEKKGISNFFMVLRFFMVYLLQRLFKMDDAAVMYKQYYK